MLDSLRIRTETEEAAVGVAHDLESRFRLALHQEGDAAWEVTVESESDDDLPDLIAILRERLQQTPPIEVLIDGVPYTPKGE